MRHDDVQLYGRIFVDGEQVALLRILAHLDVRRGLVVTLGVEGGLGDQQVSGRAQLYPVLEAALGPYLARSDVDRIEGPFLSADTAEAVRRLPGAGEPEPGSRRWYRRQDVDTRPADLEHASTLREALLRAADPAEVGLAFVEQLADDLSGRYGPYLIKFHSDLRGLRDGVMVYGRIFADGQQVGFLRILAHLDVRRGLVVTLGVAGGRGDQPITGQAQLYPALEAALDPYLTRCDVDRIEGPLLATSDTVPGPSAAAETVQPRPEAGEPNRDHASGTGFKTSTPARPISNTPAPCVRCCFAPPTLKRWAAPSLSNSQTICPGVTGPT